MNLMYLVYFMGSLLTIGLGLGIAADYKYKVKKGENADDKKRESN